MSGEQGAKENREKPRETASIFFLAVFFRVSLDGLSKRGTTRNLNWEECSKADVEFFTLSSQLNIWL